MNDIEGKAAREAVSECGQRANFNAFNQNFDLRAGALKARPLLRIRYGAKGPVDRDAFAYPGNKFRGDDFEIVFAHDLQGAVIRGEGIVEGDFVVVQAKIDAALSASLNCLASLISSSITSCVAIARL